MNLKQMPHTSPICLQCALYCICIYSMYINDTVWPWLCVGRRKNFILLIPCFCNWIIHSGSKTLSSFSAPFLLLSVSPALSVWLNTTLFHVHSSLLPISYLNSVLSSLSPFHIFFFYLLSVHFMLPLSDPFNSSVFPSLYGPLLPILFLLFSLI